MWLIAQIESLRPGEHVNVVQNLRAKTNSQDSEQQACGAASELAGTAHLSCARHAQRG